MNLIEKIEKRKSTIYIYEDHVRKVMHNDNFRPIEWFNQYKEFSKDKDYLPQIYDYIGPQEYTMERIEFVKRCNYYVKDKDQKDKEIICRIISTYTKIIQDMIEFSESGLLHKNEFWVYDDFTLDNMVVTKDGRVVLIDIESFGPSQSPLHYKYAYPLIEMSAILNDLGKRDFYV